MAVPLPLRRPAFSALPLNNTNGIIGYWPRANDNLDYSGRGLHATVQLGTPAPFITGPVGRLGAAPNNSEHLVFPANAVSSNVLTMAAWVSYTNVAANQAIVSIFTSNTDSMELFLNAAGTFFGGNFTNQATSATTSVAGRLYHVAVTSDGTTTTIFVNGFKDGVGTTHFSTFTPLGGIGTRADNTFAHIGGFLGDVRLYNRVLSHGEINALYNAGLTPPDEGEWPGLFSDAGSPTTAVYQLMNVG